MQTDTALPRVQRTITQEQIERYARASGDYNPIHIDEDFAAKSQFGGRIAHGMLIAASISEMMTAAFKADWLNGGRLKLRFRAPVFPGDTITTSGIVKRVREVDGRQQVTCAVVVRRQDGEAAITGDAVVMTAMDQRGIFRQEESNLTTGSRLCRVAVDAMGGDHAPHDVVAGAVAAVRGGGIQVSLVGDPDQVRAELAKHDVEGLPIDVVPSEGVLVEGEPPALALRQKPKASILVATGMVKQGHADAVVTMGSTGGTMAAAAVVLGRTPGVERPSIGGPIVGLAPHTFIADLGSNVDCKPAQLLGYAVIGDVFARQFWNIKRPRVAILSVGSEAGKGNALVQATSKLLSESHLNFIGNVEANDIPLGRAEVVICDGFVGNIIMKLTEGLGAALSEHLRKSLAGKLSESDLDHVIKDVYDLNNVVETLGGGPILGVNGVSVVGHGSGRADAVQRAIGTAEFAVNNGFIAKINEELSQIQQLVDN